MTTNPAATPPDAPSPPPAAPLAGQGPEPRSRARTYVAVVATEALVVAALWAFSRYFTP